MSREIELKVPLSSEKFSEIKKIILGEEKFDSIDFKNPTHILKQDEYFSLYKTHKERIAHNELKVIRIRTEKEFISPDCENQDVKSEKSFFCIKRKVIKNGVEFNSEHETFIENPDVLRNFFEASGFIKWFEKSKDSLSVHCSQKSGEFSEIMLHLELEKVNCLPYIEIECTKNDISPEKAHTAISNLLLALGINPEERDSRSWAKIIEALQPVR